MRELHSLLPLPCNVWAGHQSARCLREIQRCYLYEFDQAVVLLCLAYVERELAAMLYEKKGWRQAADARLKGLLVKGVEEDLLTDQEADVFLKLARVRRPYAHFKGSRGPTVPKMEDYPVPPAGEIAKDAARAIRTLALFLFRGWITERGKIIFYPSTS